MDLISKEAVLDGIDKYIEKAQSTGTKDDFISFAELGVKGLPSAFEGKTYGEVVKAVFPYAVIVHDKTHEMVRVIFSDEVWDSPYKGVSE